MPNKNKARHVYDPQAQRELAGIPLPSKIKCGRCEKNLIQSQYSQKQLNDARFAIKTKGLHATYKIHCIKCTGGSHIVEMECCRCMKTQGIESFAKVQRRKPDQAVCYGCMEVQLDRTPVKQEDYEDPRKAYVPTTETAGGNYPDYWSNQSARSISHAGELDGEDDGNGGVPLTQQFSGIFIGTDGTKTATLIESDYPSADDNQGGPVKGNGGWQVAGTGTKSWKSESITSPARASSSGFNPSKYGKPSTKSVSGTDHSFSTNVTERSDVVIKNGWAKIKAYVPEPQPVVEEDWASSSSDDGGDDDSDDDDDTEI